MYTPPYENSDMVFIFYDGVEKFKTSVPDNGNFAINVRGLYLRHRLGGVSETRKFSSPTLIVDAAAAAHHLLLLTARIYYATRENCDRQNFYGTATIISLLNKLHYRFHVFGPPPPPPQ